MDPGQKQYLEKRHSAQEWHGRAGAGHPTVSGFHFSGSELAGWTLHRSRREERAAPPAMRTLWHRGEPEVELVAIDVWECISIPAAHDQLLEVLGNFQSDAVERHRGHDHVGDVAFEVGHTTILFARANIVVLTRNAGPKLVDVHPIARDVDALLIRLSRP